MKRHLSTTRELKDHWGDIDVSFMMMILRSHDLSDLSTKTLWDPVKAGMDGICIHAKPIL